MAYSKPLLGFSLSPAEKSSLLQMFPLLSSVSLYAKPGQGHQAGVDVRDLGRYPAAHFSGVFSVFLFDSFIEFPDEIHAALAECARVTAPGGLFLACIDGYHLANGTATGPKLGRRTFIDWMRQAGYQAEHHRLKDEASDEHSDWFVGWRTTPPEKPAEPVLPVSAGPSTVPPKAQTERTYSLPLRSQLNQHHGRLLPPFMMTLRLSVPALPPGADDAVFAEHVFDRKTGRTTPLVILAGRALIVESKDNGQTWRLIHLPEVETRILYNSFTTDEGNHLIQCMPETDEKWATTETNAERATLFLFDPDWKLLAVDDSPTARWHGRASIDQSGGTLMFAEYHDNLAKYLGPNRNDYALWRPLTEINRVFRSRDGGRSWEAVFEGPPELIRHFHTLQADPFFPKTWWLSSGDRAEESRVWCSEDDGDTWLDVTNPSPRIVLPPAVQARSQAAFRYTDVVIGPDYLLWGCDDLLGSPNPDLALAERGGSRIYRATKTNPLEIETLGYVGQPVRSIVDVGSAYLLITEANQGYFPLKPQVIVLFKDAMDKPLELARIDNFSNKVTGFTYSKASKASLDGRFFSYRKPTNVFDGVNACLLQWDITFDGEAPVAQCPASNPNSSCLELYRQTYAALREKIVAHPLAPLAFLEITPKPSREQAVADADRLLAEGWTAGDTRRATLKPPVPWTGHPRSFEFHLHAWLPIQRLLLAFDLGRSWGHFQAALGMAEDWLAACPVQLARRTLDEAAAQVSREHEQGSWWYDMAIAQRLHRLAYIVDVCCRTPDISDERVFALMDQILLHHAVLELDSFYKKDSNHGFFQALNQYAAIKRLPEFDCNGHFLRLSQRRLEEMINRQFTQDMVHLEHSPGYHYMLTVALVNAGRAGLLAESARARLEEAQAKLGWMVMPSGQLASFGDTDPRNLFTQADIEFFEEPSLVATLTQQGQTPTGVWQCAKAGYAFARLYAKDVEPLPRNAAYLAQMTAFHSQVHKHADHHTFIWYDKRRDILIDPGRYAYGERTEPGSELHEQGFWYSDPRRIYCESTRAHNTVEIDGVSFSRTQDKPFGPALAYAGEQEGCAVTYGETVYAGSIRHRRQLVMGPGRFLLVLDWLEGLAGEAHDYRQCFLFAADWQVRTEGVRILAHHPGGGATPPLDIRVASVAEAAALGPVVRGQQEPEWLGWYSDKANSLAPASCFHLRQRAAGPVGFATLFVFGKTLEIDREATRFSRSLADGQLAWTDDQGRLSIPIVRTWLATPP